MKKTKIKLSEIKADHSLVHNITVSQYLPIYTKQLLILGFEDDKGKRYAGIIDSCIEEKDGMYYVNHFVKDIVVGNTIVNAYCEDSIEFDYDPSDQMLYDFYQETGLLAKVIAKMPEKEYWTFMELFDDTLKQEIEVRNSINGVISRSFANIIEKIPTAKQMDKLMKNAGKELKEFDVEKLGVLGSLLDLIAGK